MNNQQGSRQRLYLISFIFIVLVAGLCFVWQFRLFQGYKQIWQQEEQRYQAASKRLAVAKSLGERQQQLAREAAVLSQLLPAETAEEQLLLGLQKGLDMAGMKFVQLNFAPKIALDDLWEIPLEVVFLGRFEQVITFLQYLKSFDRALRIDELQITQSGEKGTGYFCLKASVFSLLE